MRGQNYNVMMLMLAGINIQHIYMVDQKNEKPSPRGNGFSKMSIVG